MRRRYCILDCYVDEPACLGVPPFISPYPRYIFGALLDAGVDPENIDYLTIDTLRQHDFKIEGGYESVFLIGGAAVPGKYLGYKIGTLAEITKIILGNPALPFSIGGLIGRVVDTAGMKNAVALTGDIEKHAYEKARGRDADECRSYGELARWAAPGSMVVNRHPDFPHLIAEIETYRGCPRQSRCSFCCESIRDTTEFRSEDDILAEIDALIARGITRFRIGSQPDILQYGSGLSEFRNGFSKPSVARVASLFSELKKRKDSGAIALLNIDNANPGTVANYPEESSRIIESIAESITPGDTMSLGVESLDPGVIQRNNLKVNAGELLDVVRIINEIGGRRVNGVPVLLPGVNLIHGLAGETEETFRINYEGLARIAEAGCLLRRINIRKLLPFPGTAARETAKPVPARVRNRYEYFKERIRDEIDHGMLVKVYPPGTVLKGLRVEDRQFEYSFAKQIASYAIAVKLPVLLPLKSFADVIITGHRERSLAALPLPVAVNDLPLKAIESIPGVSRKAAERIVLARPLSDISDLSGLCSSIGKEFLDAIVL